MFQVESGIQLSVKSDNALAPGKKNLPNWVRASEKGQVDLAWACLAAPQGVLQKCTQELRDLEREGPQISDLLCVMSWLSSCGPLGVAFGMAPPFLL